MNYIRHLNAFFTAIKKDDRLTSSHVSLYIALFQYWNFNRFQNPFPVYREDIMLLCKIGSKNTYHRCIKELHLLQFILYYPATAKYKPVNIAIIRLYQKIEPVARQLDLFSPNIDTNINPEILPAQVPILTDTSPIFDTKQVPNMGHLIKHINSKHKREEKSLSNSEGKNSVQKRKNVPPQVSNSVPAKKNGDHNDYPSDAPSKSIPSLEEVMSFFLQNDYLLAEAQKFFHHYNSNGWLIGGKIPMKEWQSSAHKWMLNAKEFNTNSSHDLKTDKNYSEPL